MCVKWAAIPRIPKMRAISQILDFGAFGFINIRFQLNSNILNLTAQLNLFLLRCCS